MYKGYTENKSLSKVTSNTDVGNIAIEKIKNKHNIKQRKRFREKINVFRGPEEWVKGYHEAPRAIGTSVSFIVLISKHS